MKDADWVGTVGFGRNRFAHTHHVVDVQYDRLPVAGARGQQLLAAIVFGHAQAAGKGQIAWKTVEHVGVDCFRIGHSGGGGEGERGLGGGGLFDDVRRRPAATETAIRYARDELQARLIDTAPTERTAHTHTKSIERLAITTTHARSPRAAR